MASRGLLKNREKGFMSKFEAQQSAYNKASAFVSKYLRPERGNRDAKVGQFEHCDPDLQGRWVIPLQHVATVPINQRFANLLAQELGAEAEIVPEELQDGTGAKRYVLAVPLGFGKDAPVATERQSYELPLLLLLLTGVFSSVWYYRVFLT